MWVFTTTPGHRIKLVFTEFEMEPHQVLLLIDDLAGFEKEMKMKPICPIVGAEELSKLLLPD